MTEIQGWIVAASAVLTALATAARVVFDQRRDVRERHVHEWWREK